jgi:putative transposase
MVGKLKIQCPGGNMPRQARLDTPGTLHHVIIRGIEKRRIVDDDQDRKNLIERLGLVALYTQTKILAWSLLKNHAHVLLKSGPRGLSHFMRRFLTGYAITYNFRHHRHGHLFQNRYKSIVCDEDTYFKELVRYIHLNPLRANLVKDLGHLDRYPWCGHAVLVGKIQYPWQDSRFVLSWFGKRKRDSLLAYRRYLAEGVSQGPRPDLVGGGLIRSLGGWSSVLGRYPVGDRPLADARILGVDEFVERVLKDAEPKVHYSFRSLGNRDRMERLIEESCRKKGIQKAEIKMGSRRCQISQLRAELAWKMQEEFGLPMAEIARQLGVSTSAIAKIFIKPRAK